MSKNTLSYIPGDTDGYHLPLEEFLPTLPKSVFSHWVETHAHVDKLLIDPISAHPLLGIELASSGYRVLSVRNNPIIWLITEVTAAASSAEEYTSGLNKLLNTRQGDESLSEHLQRLYETPCASCNKVIQADGFIWEKGNELPTARVYHCQFCGDEGQREITEYDIQNLKRLGKLGIHRSRAVQRVGFNTRYEQESLHTALDCYLPRPLYVCMLLINRIEGLDIYKEQENLLRLLLLSVFNDAHSLRHWPPRSHRFLQFSVPTTSFEKNLFLSLQSAPTNWQIIKKTLPISTWPNIPEAGGNICFFDRESLKDEELVPSYTPIAITTIFPRPNQVFWTLSALWSGWLWGKEGVKPMRSALNRRRYDWYWFARAVHIAAGRISNAIQNDTDIFGILPQFNPSLAFGLLTGMQTTNYRLTGSAYRTSDDILQCSWRKHDHQKDLKDKKVDHKRLLNQFLLSYGQPVEYNRLCMEIIIELAMNGLISDSINDVKDADFTHLQNVISNILTEQHFLDSFQSDPGGSSQWWLINDRHAEVPLSERVELEIRDILTSKGRIHFREIDRMICQKFPGGKTPEEELIKIILGSYADPDPNDPLVYQLRSSEKTASRDKDLLAIIDLIKEIGGRLNQTVSGNRTIYWKNPKENKITFIFHPTITTEISQYILHHDLSLESEHVIVFPASRSALIHHRLEHDLRLAIAAENNWHFQKFRFLRGMMKKDILDMAIWVENIDSDPPLHEPPIQLTII